MGDDGAGDRMIASTPGSRVLFTAAPALVVALLALLVIAEAVLLPGMVLPGGTGVALAGALAGAGRAPIAAVVAGMALAVLGGDHAAYLAGGHLLRWWRGRRGSSPQPAPAAGRWRDWALAALPSVAGARRQPYRRFLPRLLILRAVWFTGFFTAGVLASQSLGALERVGGPLAVVVSALIVAVLLAVPRRRQLTGLVRRDRLAVTGLIVLAVAAAWVAGGVVQDAVNQEEFARIDPQVAALLARHIPDGVARATVSVARLANPPGLWLVAPMAILFAHLLARGHSTLRFAVAAAGAALLTGAADLVLAAPGGRDPVHPGPAVFAALWLTWTIFASRWLPPGWAVVAIVAATAVLIGLAVALIVTQTPTTSVLAGSCLGLAWAALIEALLRIRTLPVARLLGDHPQHAG